MSDTLVKVENVSKKFCRSLKKSLWYGMKDLGSELIGRSHGGNGELRQDEFWAVNDVSFELKRGECLGLIGRNGAGKTTLLRILNGLIKPDRGSIEMRGRVGALISLGAGFNPILTGRENIYVNASVLGLKKKEIDAKFDEIIDFAELGEFIDAPVQSYSSGMAVRLGFAVASSLNPDVLLLDEVLAVGDTRFRAKCLQRIKAVRQSGGVILLVTHTLEEVAHFCDRAMLLDKGKMMIDDETSRTLNYYICILSDRLEVKVNHAEQKNKIKEAVGEKFQNHMQYNPNETRWGDNAATITDIRLSQEGRECDFGIVPGLSTELEIGVFFYTDIMNPIYGLSIKKLDGGIIFGTNSRELLSPIGAPPQKEGDSVRICFGFMPFLDAGEYLLSVGVASESPDGIQAHDRRYDSIKLNVSHPLSESGDIAMNPTFRIL
jgi:lipopolysaccharide transport system ATP-binding protein